MRLCCSHLYPHPGSSLHFPLLFRLPSCISFHIFYLLLWTISLCLFSFYSQSPWPLLPLFLSVWTCWLSYQWPLSSILCPLFMLFKAPISFIALSCFLLQLIRDAALLEMPDINWIIVLLGRFQSKAILQFTLLITFCAYFLCFSSRSLWCCLLFCFFPFSSLCSRTLHNQWQKTAISAQGCIDSSKLNYGLCLTWNSCWRRLLLAGNY